MAEKESKHIVDKYIVNYQQRGIFIVSPNNCMHYIVKEI